MLRFGPTLAAVALLVLAGCGGAAKKQATNPPAQPYSTPSRA
jgi:outer membrane biogenesis lipoprotein LolB